MKKKTTTITTSDVEHVADLSNLSISDAQKKTMSPQLDAVIEYMSKIQSLDTKGVEETAHVTGLENIFREDEVNEAQMLSQEEALSNSKRTHNGYFVVDAVFDES